MDLTARKMADGGTAAFALIDEVQSHAEAARTPHPDLATDLWQAAESLRETTEALLKQDLTDRFAGAVPYLRAFALILGADAHLRAAHADSTRAALARIAIKRLLPEQAGLLTQARLGAADLYALTPEDLAA
jgi:acyl-CoA dehydrogenase